jgi:hypothetical protein
MNALSIIARRMLANKNQGDFSVTKRTTASLKDQLSLTKCGKHL